MVRPTNIYCISRFTEPSSFNIVERHHSQKVTAGCVQIHEIESLRSFCDMLIAKGLKISELDGFFFSYKIPQIGKEFDLLKFSEKTCINIELKSQSVPEAQIQKQLKMNRHFLNHLGRKLFLYTVTTDSFTCHKLSLNGDLVPVDFSEIANVLKQNVISDIHTVDGLFRPSDYLVSPINNPSKFIQGEYFLTQAQENIKTQLLGAIDASFSSAYFHLTGKPGTGKTLLLYDVAKALSQNGKVLLIHCGKLTDGQRKLNAEMTNLDIISAGQMKEAGNVDLTKYIYILVDESHRIYEKQYSMICESVETNKQACIFSSDPEQVLSAAETRRDIVGEIKKLALKNEFTLSEKIRTNAELHSFILRMRNLNHKSKTPIKYSHVQLSYANSPEEAQELLNYYRAMGFVFINYSKSNFTQSPYSFYTEDFDTHHVIGQEFDNVVMLMDSSFFYDEGGNLKGIEHPNPDYLYPKLFYQGITRVREALAIVVVEAPELFRKIASIFSDE